MFGVCGVGRTRDYLNKIQLFCGEAEGRMKTLAAIGIPPPMRGCYDSCTMENDEKEVEGLSDDV